MKNIPRDRKSSPYAASILNKNNTNNNKLDRIASKSPRKQQTVNPTPFVFGSEIYSSIKRKLRVRAIQLTHCADVIQHKLRDKEKYSNCTWVCSRISLKFGKPARDELYLLFVCHGSFTLHSLFWKSLINDENWITLHAASWNYHS